MSVYRGVVKGDVVVLSEGVKLADGATVEVRVIASPNRSGEAAELSFKQRLVESGLLAEVRTAAPSSPRGDRTPVEVQGPPLSEAIVQERR